MEMQPAELSVIVPTFNERDNVAELCARLDKRLAGRSWEVIFVDDDSPDDTAAEVRRLAQQNRHVRALQRIGRRGLSSACIEGMLSSSAPFLVVMDADLQHDEGLVPRMLDALKSGEADIVIGSRYTEGGGIGDWESSRARMSRLATHLSRLVVRAKLSDPMSGFFAMRREVLEESVRDLSSIGFKILLDILASSPVQFRLKELPYQFRNRHAGESKLDSVAVWEYLMLLADKLVGRYIPVRFVAFAAIGGFGILVHFMILTMLFGPGQMSFEASQASAALVAMTSNFLLNNALTYRDKRLRGWRMLTGWLSFALVCAVGLLANVGIASYLFISDTAWAIAALAGIAVGAVWNYAVTATFTWRNAARRERAGNSQRQAATLWAAGHSGSPKRL
jgi:dolichol-phosphate mannosyltransferase